MSPRVPTWRSWRAPFALFAILWTIVGAGAWAVTGFISDDTVWVDGYGIGWCEALQDPSPACIPAARSQALESAPSGIAAMGWLLAVFIAGGYTWLFLPEELK